VQNTNTIRPTSPTAAPRRRSLRWRVVDIVVASVIGVASGVIFWAWGLAWTPLSGVLAFTPGLEGLLAGGWLFAGVLGGLVIRKPGAAIYTELVAAVVSMIIGTQWGFSTLIWGLLDTTFTSYAALELQYKLVYIVSAIVSGVVLAGLLSWLAMRGLARTGALSRFAAGRETRVVEAENAAA
jgi:energy-coupling factor transport system substrate-specific component